MVEIVEPRDYDEIKDVILETSRDEKKVKVVGTQSNELEADSDVLLSLRKITGILDLSEDDNYVKVKAGTPFHEVQEFLRRRGYMIPHSYWGSVGGLFSLNLPSVFSFWFGLPKDILLGATICTGLGEVVKSGGVTTKFSSGYKIWKALSGSMGKLGVFLDLTIKIIKTPEEMRFVKVKSDEAYPLMMSNKRPWGVACGNVSGEIECEALFAGFSRSVEQLSSGYEPGRIQEIRSPFIKNTRLGDELRILNEEKALVFPGVGLGIVEKREEVRLTKSFLMLKRALDPNFVLV
ncbi:FAD-binding oxidoreductase [Sulfuracidifex tepidarius]|uniref:D-lactate dehydrogenase n=1 Tax=Sulfuracidifex tepidarius TaxID=1294262 RepID=A0A510E4K4_9CREN|nr:FAD-binding oxidoreductase [Sulfuracidifex tepidarius]BBG24674.1 D-lactate dehydrogenase [Sulfuracidifex tepidarius]BBG27462.1 D-lactate dehydrogenase [Sulfuracidifex tepidarius]